MEGRTDVNQDTQINKIGLSLGPVCQHVLTVMETLINDYNNTSLSQWFPLLERRGFLLYIHVTNPNLNFDFE